MDSDSPFAEHQSSQVNTDTKIVHVNYCAGCHYVWKAPAKAEKCLNCKNNPDLVISLVSYSTGIPIQ